MSNVRRCINVTATCGLAVASFWLVAGLGFGIIYPPWVLYVFPSASITMLLSEGFDRPLDIAGICAAAVAVNVVLYAVIGALLATSWNAALRIRRLVAR